MSSEAPTRPRWGHKVSLWQARQPAFWVFILMVAAGVIISFLFQLGFAEISPDGLALSWFLMLLYAVPMFLLVYVLDLYEREPLSLVFGALLWGGFVATVLSVIASFAWQGVVFELLGDNALAWGAAVIAPPVEEILKACGIVFIVLIARSEVDDILDGFVYGAMVGLGFTVVEDVLYFMGVFGGSVAGVLEGFFIRVVASGLYGHVLYSGLFGIAIAYFVTRRGVRPLGRRVGVAAGLMILAILGHALWNSPILFFFPEQLDSPAAYLQMIAATAVKGIPMLLFVILMLRLAHRREHRWLRAALTGEVGGPGIAESEMTTLEDPGRRRRARREIRARSGAQAASTLKKLHRAQIDLAMIRSRVEEDDHPDLVRQREYCAALRAWLVTHAGHPEP